MTTPLPSKNSGTHSKPHRGGPTALQHLREGLQAIFKLVRTQEAAPCAQAEGGREAGRRREAPLLFMREVIQN